MKKFIKNWFLVSLIFLSSSNITLTEDYFTCTMDGMKGKLDSNVCEIKEFIKSLPKYDQRNSKLYKRNNYIFYGKPGTGKTRCIDLLEKETGAIVIRYDLPTFLKNHGDIEKVYKEAQKILERENRPVILVFENADQEGANGGGILHWETQDRMGNPYLWTIVTAHDYFKLTEGLRSRCNSAKFRLPDRSVRKETIEEEGTKHSVNIPWFLLQFGSILSSGKSIGNIEQKFKNASEQSKNGELNTKYIIHELSKDNYATAGVISVAATATLYTLIYGIRSGKIYSILQKLLSQKPKPKSSEKDKK